MPKTKVILEQIEENHYYNLYLDNFDRKYLVDNNKNTKIPDIKHNYNTYKQALYRSIYYFHKIKVRYLIDLK